jgi:hypothetical protein
VVTLVEEGPPVEGRIVDLEGRPVAGASVHTARFWYDGRGNIAGWIAKARNGAVGNLWQGLENLSFDAISPGLGHGASERLVTIAASTGADGRFKLTGIGRDRIADLIISGTGIATTQVFAFNRSEPEIRTFVDNPHAREYSEFSEGSEQYAPFDEQGRYEVVALPGRGLIGVREEQERYRPATGYEKIAGYDAKD